MNFTYNGNLLEEERLNLVAEEIRNIYPEISLTQAIDIAMLEEPISKNKDFFMEFKRLYNILLVILNEKVSSKVYRDLIILVKSQNLNSDDIYNKITKELYCFLIGEREFPYFEEFIEE